MMAQKESENFMKAYARIAKIAMTVMLLAAFFLLSGFRAQTIIHDDGSETQDVLKVSDSAKGQKDLKADADEFQKRNYTIMDYNNDNGEGFRAMKTITKDGASKSSVDHIVHKTHDGLICSTYYIDYNFDENSIQTLRLGAPMPENGVDLEYIVSFPSGTRVVSNSDKADDQGSTYLWNLSNSNPTEIKLQATVWHKLFIYIALFLVVLVLIIVLIMEHRRKNVISWKRAAHMRKLEMMLLCIPIIILGYMGYEYYVGTHVTAASLDKVAEQQQEELLESREEDKKIHDADAQKQRSGELAAARIRTKTAEISSALRELNRNYHSGRISQRESRSQASALAEQAQEMLFSSKELSQADQDVLQQLVDRLVSEANSIGDEPAVSQTERRGVSEEQQRADAMASKDKDSPSDERAKNEESERQEEASSDSGAPQERKGGSDAGKSESEKKPK